MEFYSPEKTEYAWKHECGYKNYINPNHVWVVDYNDVKQVEMMKDKVRTLIKEAKEEAKNTLGSKAVKFLSI